MHWEMGNLVLNSCAWRWCAQAALVSTQKCANSVVAVMQLGPLLFRLLLINRSRWNFFLQWTNIRPTYLFMWMPRWKKRQAISFEENCSFKSQLVWKQATFSSFWIIYFKMLSTSVSSPLYCWSGEANPAGFLCVRSQVRWDKTFVLLWRHKCKLSIANINSFCITKKKSITLLFSHEPCHRQSKSYLFMPHLHVFCIGFTIAPGGSQGLIHLTLLL